MLGRLWLWDPYLIPKTASSFSEKRPIARAKDRLELKPHSNLVLAEDRSDWIAELGFRTTKSERAPTWRANNLGVVDA